VATIGWFAEFRPTTGCIASCDCHSHSLSSAPRDAIRQIPDAGHQRQDIKRHISNVLHQQLVILTSLTGAYSVLRLRVSSDKRRHKLYTTDPTMRVDYDNTT